MLPGLVASKGGARTSVCMLSSIGFVYLSLKVEPVLPFRCEDYWGIFVEKTRYPETVAPREGSSTLARPGEILIKAIKSDINEGKSSHPKLYIECLNTEPKMVALCINLL